jgi:hypothetical protein
MYDKSKGLTQAENLCDVCNVGDGLVHHGPHPKDYHDEVAKRLRDIINMRGPKELKQLLVRKMLVNLCIELNQEGNNMRNLVAK